MNKEFLAITVALHPICESHLLNVSWIFLTMSTSDSYIAISNSDFRSGAASYFRSLSIFCTLAQRSIDDALVVFGSSQLINARLIPRQQFVEQIESLVTNFINISSIQFTLNLRIIRDTTQGNQLLTAYGTNALLSFNEQSSSSQILVSPSGYFVSVVFEEIAFIKCWCVEYAACYIQQGFLAPAYLRVPMTPIVGLVVACTPVESVLLSTLECWSDQECLSMVMDHLNISIHTLDTIPSSIRFAANDTFGTILEQLAVDEWRNESSYEHFFHACSPVYCTYTLTERYNLLFILVSVIGLFGGISEALRLFVPGFVRVVMQFIRRIKQRRNPPETTTGNPERTHG